MVEVNSVLGVGTTIAIATPLRVTTSIVQVGIQRVALREKGAELPSSPLLKGSAILRDGKVGLLLDLEALVDGYA